MSLYTAALIGTGILLLLMLLRMPVAFATLLTGFLGLLFIASPEAAFNVLSGVIWEEFSSYGLSVIPLFVLMGEIAFYSGVTDKLFQAAHKWVGHVKGGLAATAIVASSGFAAICGSNSATTATMGAIALPQMKKYGYDPVLSAGAVACGGTLGVMIPPSIVLLVVAMQTELSVAKLFVATIIPGLLLSGLFILTILFLCSRNASLGPAGPKASLREKVAALTGIIETLLLFAFVIGGLYAGWFTPTEAGAAGSFGALVIALAQRKLSWEAFKKSVLETLRISAMVMMLVTGADVFGRFLTMTRLPFVLADWAAALPVPPLAILAVICLIYILGGTFMDALAFLVVSVPVFFPLVMALGYDPVWFAILLNVLTTMGAITPPDGVCLYIVMGLAPDIPSVKVFKGVLYFIPAYIACIILLIAFPQLVTWVN